MPVKYVKDFDFSRECGFTGSAMRQGGPVRKAGYAVGGPVAGVQSPASVVAPGPSPAPSASPLSRATITMPVGDAAKAAVGMVQAGKQLGARQTMGGLARATNAVRARQGMDPRMPSPAAGLAPAAAAPGQVPQARVPGLAKGGFIQGMHLKKGALHRQMGVPEGEKIPAGRLAKAAHSDNPLLAKRARTAEMLKGLGKK